MLKVVCPGQKVQLGGGVPATVLAVSVGTGDRVQYRVVWWDGRNRRDEWLEECEVDANGAARTPIGFLPAKDGT